MKQYFNKAKEWAMDHKLIAAGIVIVIVLILVWTTNGV